MEDMFKSVRVTWCNSCHKNTITCLNIESDTTHCNECKCEKGIQVPLKGESGLNTERVWWGLGIVLIVVVCLLCWLGVEFVLGLAS